VERYLVAVTLYVRRGREGEFRDFEDKALAIGARHGCEVVRAARLSSEACDSEAPYEFHLLSFPSEAAFSAFRADPDSRSLDEERARVITKVEVVAGVESKASA